MHAVPGSYNIQLLADRDDNLAGAEGGLGSLGDESKICGGDMSK